MRTKIAWIATLALVAFLTPAAYAGGLQVQASNNAAVVTAAIDDLDITVAPKVESVTGDTAVITWTTSAQASSTVKYGTDRNNLDQTKQGGWGGPEHKVTINGLKPGTTYYYQVVSGEGKNTGTGSIAKVESFTTGNGTAAGNTGTAAKSGNDLDITVAPKVENVSDKTALITWTTSAQSSSTIKYGTDKNNLDQTKHGGWGGPDHKVTISGLKPGTTYYYQVVSTEGKNTGTGSMGKVDSFTTTGTGTATATGQATTPAATGTATDKTTIQVGPVAQNVTDKTAVLWWMATGTNAAGSVKYGKDKNNLTETAQAAAGNEHRVQLSNLEPGVTYYFQLIAQDGSKRADGQFKTEGADFAQRKFRITNGPVIEMVGKDSAVIAWSTNARASSTVRYGTDPNNLNLSAQAPWGQETHRVVVRNLKPQTKYYFAVESSQAEGTGLSAKSNTSPFSTVGADQQAMRNPDGR